MQLTILESTRERTSMSFSRHEEIYRSDVSPGYSGERQLNVAAPVLIGCDEFPVGYSLAGCPPAEPASASPTANDSQPPTLPYNDFSANGNYPLYFVSQPKGALHKRRPLLQTSSPASYEYSSFKSMARVSFKTVSRCGFTPTSSSHRLCQNCVRTPRIGGYGDLF